MKPIHRHYSFLSLALVLSACGGGKALETESVRPSVAAPAAGPEAAAATITADDMYQRIAFLASDELAGRDTPSPGLEMAAEYVAGEFERFGLQPAGENGTYYQRYALQRRGLNVDAVRLALVGETGATEFAFGTDFAAVAGAPGDLRGELVFAGAGLDASQADALRGQVPVVFLSGLPNTPSFYRSLNRQVAMAERVGAAGAIFVMDPQFPDEEIQRLAEAIARPRGLSIGEAKNPPAAFVRYTAAKRAFASAGHDLDELRERAAAGTSTVEPLAGLSIEFAAPVQVLEDHRAPNVVAVLPGSDPELRDTYVVFSAHMDHVGVGGCPSVGDDDICNGADDNASGTAALIEVAEAFAALPTPPARSLVFLAVSGEEKGLLGSYYYSENPTVPLEKTVANINVDMIGRNAPDSIVVIGQEYSSLGPLVRGVAEARPELGLTVAQDLWPEERFFFRSDHFNFARKDIPALFFFAGVHEDYHRASDHVEKIDSDKAARVAQLIFHTAYAIANDRTAPTWTEEGLREVRALVGGGR